MCTEENSRGLCCCLKFGFRFQRRAKTTPRAWQQRKKQKTSRRTCHDRLVRHKELGSNAILCTRKNQNTSRQTCNDRLVRHKELGSNAILCTRKNQNTSRRTCHDRLVRHKELGGRVRAMQRQRQQCLFGIVTRRQDCHVYATPWSPCYQNAAFITQLWLVENVRLKIFPCVWGACAIFVHVLQHRGNKMGIFVRETGVAPKDIQVADRGDAQHHIFGDHV